MKSFPIPFICTAEGLLRKRILFAAAVATSEEIDVCVRADVQTELIAEYAIRFINIIIPHYWKELSDGNKFKIGFCGAEIFVTKNEVWALISTCIGRFSAASERD